MKLLQASINHLMEKIASSAFALKQLKSTRDIRVQIKNANNIDMFSSMQTIIILCTAIVQVVVIRKFFSNTSKNFVTIR